MSLNTFLIVVFIAHVHCDVNLINKFKKLESFGTKLFIRGQQFHFDALQAAILTSRVELNTDCRKQLRYFLSAIKKNSKSEIKGK